MTSPMMTKFCPKMSIHISCTLGKFDADWTSLSKVIEKKFLAPPPDAPRVKQAGFFVDIVRKG